MAAKLWTTNQGQISGDLVSDLQGHKSLLEVMPICWYTDLARKVYCLPLSTRNLHPPSPQTLSNLHLHISYGSGDGGENK